jgi:hypothetical protein
MSANCLFVSMYLISISPFSMWSLRKWCLLSTCLIFLWKTGFLATEMALVSSHYPKNLRAAASSSYIIGPAGGLCNRRLFARRPIKKRRSKKWQVPEMIFRSIPQPAKLQSEKPTRSNEEEAECQISNSGVCLRYLKIHWTTVRCEEHGEVWKRAQRHTMNWMFGRVAMRYRREPIMLLYSLWSIA